jgi:hypothetical protein
MAQEKNIVSSSDWPITPDYNYRKILAEVKRRRKVLGTEFDWVHLILHQLIVRYFPIQKKE